MKIGFTGTREGLTPTQAAVFAKVIRELPNIEEFHHGDCVGADDQAATLFNRIWPDVPIHVHPCTLVSQRAFNGAGSKVMYPIEKPLARNDIIVNYCQYIIGCPQGPETNRGGTWYTIRRAKKAGRPTMVIYPNGTKVSYNLK